jgi:hypothetical protein
MVIDVMVIDVTAIDVTAIHVTAIIVDRGTALRIADRNRGARRSAAKTASTG